MISITDIEIVLLYSKIQNMRERGQEQARVPVIDLIEQEPKIYEEFFAVEGQALLGLAKVRYASIPYVEPRDLVQEAFARTLERGQIRKEDGAGGLRRFIATTMSNYATDMLRRQMRRREYPLDSVDDAESLMQVGEQVDTTVTDRVYVESLLKAIDRNRGHLSELDWEMLRLLLDDPSISESDLSEILGINTEAVHSRKSRLRNKLHRIMEREGLVAA